MTSGSGGTGTSAPVTGLPAPVAPANGIPAPVAPANGAASPDSAAAVAAPGRAPAPAPGSARTPPTRTAGAPTRYGSRPALLLGTAVALFFVVGLLGPSDVTTGPAGAVVGRPPYSLGLSAPAWVVIAVTAAGLLSGAAGLVQALRAMAGGWAPNPRRWLGGGLAAVLSSLLVPPAASGDALIYAAYGRIAALGGDPYVDSPRALVAFNDPLGLGTEGPWQNVTSVYGPLATAVQEGASRLAGTSMQQTLWWLSVVNVATWIGAGALLLTLVRGDVRARSRVLVLYWANPLLLWAVPFGGHNDSQALVFAVGALLALRARSVLAGAALSGALIGAAGTVKLTEGVVGLGLLWALRRRPAAAVLLCLTAAAVLLLAYVPHWPEVFSQTSDNSSFVSSASPWRWARELIDLALSGRAARRLVTGAAWVSVVIVAALLLRRIVGGRGPGTGARARPMAEVAQVSRGDGVRARGVDDAARATAAVTVAWMVLGSYTLPWYDLVAWAPLLLISASTLDMLLIARTTMVCVAYIATRNVVPALAPSGAVKWLADRVRDTVSPVVHIGLAIILVRWSRGYDGWQVVPVRLRRRGGANRVRARRVDPATSPDRAAGSHN